jgi:hypothetical protein
MKQWARRIQDSREQRQSTPQSLARRHPSKYLDPRSERDLDQRIL